jgi:CheY-like chemotaxis protein
MMNTVLLRILILEDDEDIVELIESILDRNYEFITAANGLEGLQVAEVGEPDLIICDVMMPVMNGWDFMKALREKPGFEKTPVIFLSALSAQDQIKKGYALGAGLFLTKPIDPARLKRNIELFVDDHGIVPRPKRKRVDQLRAQSAADFLKFAEPKLAAAPRPPAAPASPQVSPAPPASPVARAGQEAHSRILPAEIKRMTRPTRRGSWWWKMTRIPVQCF